MGCGSSSQPAENGEQRRVLTAGSKDTATADEVEPFNNKTPSPKSKTKQKETISDGPTPEPSAYVAATVEDDMDTLSSIGTPFGSQSRGDGSPHSSQDMHGDNIRSPMLSPGYKMENETRKIGGFDPEAFRKANAGNNGSNQAGDQAGDSWAAPVPSNTNNNYQQQQQQYTGGNTMGGGNGGGYQNRDGGEMGGNGYGNMSHNSNAGGDRWGQASGQQGDYIQSEDIFSSQSPQAMQNSSSMHFRDDPSGDPFANSGHSDPFRSPGGMGHNPAQPERKLITHEDDALMDDILGELDEL